MRSKCCEDTFLYYKTRTTSPKMVLAELGGKITRALANMRNSTVIDEAVVDEMLKEIGNALIAADVQVSQNRSMVTNCTQIHLVMKLRKKHKELHQSDRSGSRAE